MDLQRPSFWVRSPAEVLGEHYPSGILPRIYNPTETQWEGDNGPSLLHPVEQPPGSLPAPRDHALPPRSTDPKVGKEYPPGSSLYFSWLSVQIYGCVLSLHVLLSPLTYFTAHHREAAPGLLADTILNHRQWINFISCNLEDKERMKLFFFPSLHTHFLPTPSAPNSPPQMHRIALVTLG